MSWITEIFSSSAGAIVEKVGGAIDRLVTSDEERLQLKNELEKIVGNQKAEANRHIESMEQAVTDRHKNDMTSDSWLSKNIRPLTMIFLTVMVVFLAYLTVFSDTVKQGILDSWIDLFTALLMLAYGFYYGSRGIEKVASLIGRRTPPKS